VVSHAHGVPSAPADRRTRRILAAVLIPAALATVVAMLMLWPGRVQLPTPGNSGERVNATVTAIAGAAVTVRMRNETAVVDSPVGPGAPRIAVGDDVVLLKSAGAVPGGRDYTIVDHQRGGPMIWLLLAAVASVLAFGRKLGLTALVGLAVSFGVLLFFIVPAILSGEKPLLVAVVGASAIMFAALYLTHGVNVHTSVAIAGTLASLVVTGVLGYGFTAALHLTGVAGDEDTFLAATRSGIDMRGLLLAGIVIGALGVLDDVTVTQAATVAELAGPGDRGRRDIYRAAARVGRAHVASAVNTLVLAYAGASLPLLLLLATGTAPVGQVLTGELLAQEILRSAVGTIGLVASVPITTALAVTMIRNRSAGPRSSPPARSPRHSRT
jgi:uncharacterized membrane protein